MVDKPYGNLLHYQGMNILKIWSCPTHNRVCNTSQISKCRLSSIKNHRTEEQVECSSPDYFNNLVNNEGYHEIHIKDAFVNDRTNVTVKAMEFKDVNMATLQCLVKHYNVTINAF